jgi:hypothetical protein
VTIPAVPSPKDGSIRTPLDFTLKAEWWFDTKKRTFTSAKGETFSPFADLPAGSKIVYKAPDLARANPAKMNEHERALRRYMQLILPAGVSPSRLVSAVRKWPPVDDAHAGPEFSLPKGY